MHIEIDNITSLADAAQEFVSAMNGNKVFAFNGAMGAGKTTFISAVSRALGAQDEASSPTFALVNEYTTKEGGRIFHFDFYRVDSLEEVIDMGAEDYFYSGDICFIEWPDIAEAVLPEDVVRVNITVDPDSGKRIVEAVMPE